MRNRAGAAQTLPQGGGMSDGNGELFSDVRERFVADLPAGWTTEPDPESGGVDVYPAEGSGVLHLLAFPGEPDEFLDPAEELYAFLDEQGIELQEEELEDLELPGEAEMAYTEYVAEADDDDDDGPMFHIMGVATAPGMLVFASYSCPAGEEDRHRDAVIRIFRSLQLNPDTGSQNATEDR